VLLVSFNTNQHLLCINSIQRRREADFCVTREKPKTAMLTVHCIPGDPKPSPENRCFVHEIVGWQLCAVRYLCFVVSVNTPAGVMFDAGSLPY